MHRSLDVFLRNYDPGDRERFLKARLIIMVTIAVILSNE